MRGTTILAVRKSNRLVVVGDGQVSAGDIVLKSSARKIRRLGPESDTLAGFAGATSDAFTLYEKLEEQIERFPRRLERAAVELAREWRSDKILRNLDAMLIAGDRTDTLIVTGRGDVVRPDHPIAAIGSGGQYALAAARAMYDHELDAERIARTAMEIAASICVYTNTELNIEILETS